jgi:hypothetical protein
MLKKLFLLIAASVWILSCSGDDNGNGNGDGDDGGGRDAAEQDGSNGTDGKKDGGGGEYPICDEQEINASPLSNMLLVIDKSDSMKDPTSVNDQRQKAEVLVESMKFVLDTYQGKIRFGWMAFPNRTDCDPGVVSVELGDDSADTIRSLLDSFFPWGKTPTGETLENADEYYTQLNDTERTNFVVLVTDGLPTCPNGNGLPDARDDALALGAVGTLYSHGVGTFVIGLGEDINNSNPDLLDDMAEAGGHPRDGAEKYYPANNQTDLEAAFRDIAKVVMECHLDLGVVPEEPDFLWVYFDGQPISRDRAHLNGFDYDAANNRIDFYGEACDKLKNGEVVKVDVKMGCAPPD